MGRNVVKQRKSRKSIFNKEKISKLFKKVGLNKGKPNQVIGKRGKTFRLLYNDRTKQGIHS